MRYVVIIMSVTFYVLWEVLYGHWYLTNSIIREVTRVWNEVIGMIF